MSTEISYCVDSVSQTQTLAENLAAKLQKGDLIMLSGDLGAGKTTFTKGLGKGLKVRGEVSSPTFIVARVHPSLVDGPDLIHVDAYRITSLDDLETLDLDSTVEDAVTVVEWGDGKVEGINQSRLEIKVKREIGQVSNEILDLTGDGVTIIDLTEVDSGIRTITFMPIGERWQKENLDSLLN